MYHGSSYFRSSDSREAGSEDLLSLCLVHPPQGVVHDLPAQMKSMQQCSRVCAG